MINTYAPTMMRAKENPKMTEAYHQQLAQTYSQERRGMTSTFILGDLNAKIGKPHPDDDAFMGKHNKLIITSVG